MHLNNACWDELESERVDDPRRLSYQAYASAYHWSVAGGPIECCRAEHLLSRVALLAGDVPRALEHAIRCRQLLTEVATGAEPWDEVFANEALARAHAAAGDSHEAKDMLASAEASLLLVEDREDREVARSVLEGGQWYGLR